MIRLIHRHMSKSVIALLMSVMLLFSSLGTLVIPINQAFASNNVGTDTSVSTNVYLSNAKNYYDSTTNKVFGNFLDTLAYRGAWGSDFTGYTLPPEFGQDFTSSTASGYGDRILGVLSVGGNPYKTTTGQNLVKALVEKQNASGYFDSSNLTVHAWAVIGLNAANAVQYYNQGKSASAKAYDKSAAISWIISKQNASTGAIGSNLSSTSPALIALAGAREISGVDAAIQKAVAYLKTQQKSTGDFAGGFGSDMTDTSTAVMALTSVGIDVSSSDWTVNGLNPISVFAKYQLAAGGFANTTANLTSGKVYPATTQNAIIALSQMVSGVSVWDKIKFNVDVNGDLSAVDLDYAFLSLGDTSYTINNLSLPITGPFGSTVTWTSSDKAVASNGIVTRPVFPEDNKVVTLNATLTKGGAVVNKPFTIRVIASTDKITAGYLLSQSKNYYDVVKNKNLTSWWDLGAVFSGWGSFDGYTVPSYTGQLTASQPTDYAGLILGMISTGKNPYQTPSGQNIVDEFLKTKQGTGGSFSALSNQQMWSIIALNAANAEEIYNRANPAKPYDKKGAVEKLIAMQSSNGSFGSLADYTGMALIALSGSREIDGVNDSITKAINNLKSIQLQTGVFTAGWANDNGNTDATVISGLVAAGEDLTSRTWAVGNKTPIDTLAQYQNANGGFMYKTALGVDSIASYQAIIALGDLITGDSVWKRIKLKAGSTDEQIVADDKASLDLGDLTGVTTNIMLPIVGAKGSTITWSSSNTAVITNNGTVTRPIDQQATVSLTATIIKGSVQATKNFTAVVSAVAPQTINVSIVVSGFSAVANKSVTLVKADTSVNVGKSAAYAITKVLDMNGIHVENASGNYITSIGDLAVGDGGPDSGWMYLVNGQFAAVGIDKYILQNNDVIKFVYTDDYRQDITTIADKTTLNAKISEINTLDQGIYTTSSWQALQSSLTFAKTVSASSSAIQYHADSALAGLNTAFQNLAIKSTPIGHVTVSVEKFTLGQGYYREPAIVPFYEGDNGAAILTRVLGIGNYVNKNTVDDSFYLSKVKDPTSSVHIPQYILDQIGAPIGSKSEEAWLGEFDYTSTSGWMYAVNNKLPNVGMSQYIPEDGDVMRTQFTVYGLGADLSVGTADKDALTATIAEINSDPNKEAILLNNDLKAAYDQAYTVLANMESTQSSVDKALADLDNLLGPDTVKPVITVSGITNNQQVSQLNLSFSVEVTDNRPGDLIPVVKQNGTAITSVNGVYPLILLPGTNTITISVTDVAGNKTVQTYSVIYEISTVITPESQLNKNLAYILKTVAKPTFGTSGGEWSVLSLARANYEVPKGYYQGYYNNVANKVKELIVSNNGVLDKNKGTEHSRAILGLTAIGKDPRSVGDYNLITALADYDYVIKQGLNGPIYTLLALDTRNYEIPTVTAGKKQVTRDKLIDYILSTESHKGAADAGGWSLLGTGNAEVDITAMALQALAPYYETRPDVKSAGDRAVAWLAKSQDSEGGFGDTSESIAQVITALSALGINPSTDARFIKEGKSALYALLSFAVADGGFQHVKSGPGSGVDNMATDQGTYALVAYDRFVNGSKRLYDMTDVKEDTSSGQIEIPLPSGNQPVIEIPSNNKDYIIPVTNADANKEIKIVILSDNNSKIQVNLPSNSSLPKLEASKGNVSLLIPKGAQITSGNSSALELITTNNAADVGLRNKVVTLIPSGKQLDSVNQAITLGGSNRIEFDQFITLTFTGMKGMDAAYIQNGTIASIHKYVSDAEGLASNSNEYAYENGNDLIVKTKHFTDFIAYASSSIQAPGGGTTQPLTPHVTLKVDKQTINKGDVIPAVSVELKAGDSVWSVLKRELDSRGISYDTDWSVDYDSIYVKSIAGDGEFDHGTGSGWMYNVNGTYPGVGASKTFLNNGDSIQWRYTTNLGEDLGVKRPPGAGVPGPFINPNDKKPTIDVPADIKEDYFVNITKELKDKELITINIPNVTSKVLLNLEEVKDSIPMITAVKGDITLSIDKGTVLKSGNSSIELLTTLDTSAASLQNVVKSDLSSDIAKQLKLTHAFAMGNANQSVLFDKPLTLVIKGGKGQQTGFIEANTFTPIEIYESEAKAIEATKGKEKITYAFVNGNDLVIKTNHFTNFVTYTVGSESEQVFDLNKLYTDASSISTWALDAISEASQKAFVSGSYGKFNPQATITRAEFTKILVGVLGLDVKTSAVINFKDVTPDDWFYPYVNAAFKAGFISGYSDDQFNPNEKLTREQMAVIIVKALGLPAADQTAMIEDEAQVSNWAKASVQIAIAQGLMSGWDNRFQPSDEVTREMATVVAMRAYHAKADAGQGTVKPDVVKKAEVEKQINQTAAFLQQTITDPVVASIGGDWTIVGLGRSGVPVPDAYYAKYYANIEKILKEKSGKLHAIKYTEYDRVILGLTSIGRNVDEVAGYNLREWLADYETLIKQGINGPIFALIALDSKNYDIPVGNGVKKQTTRELLVDFILNREIAGGGWALGESVTEPDPDITAMAIQGLTPYYQTNKNVQAAVDRALVWLSKSQKADGSYASQGAANSESSAQVIVALTGLGINPHTDVRFIKNGSSAIDALLSFSSPNGGFYHVKSGGVDNGGGKPGEVDPMATDQAMYALVAYDRLLKGQNRLYDMTDVK